MKNLLVLEANARHAILIGQWLFYRSKVNKHIDDNKVLKVTLGGFSTHSSKHTINSIL